MRINESCVGLTGLTVLQNPMNVDQKQQGIHIGVKRLGRPKPPGTIDVIGASSSQMNSMRPQAARENIIQVMTADRREYSRTVVGNQQGGVGFNNPPPESYYNNDQDAYNYGYEPTQEQQWDHQNSSSNWAPREIKELTGIGNQPQPIMNIPPPSMHVPSGMMQGGHNMMPQMSSGASGSSLKPLMNDPRDRREPAGRDNRNYDRKRMRSNSRDRKDRRERSPERTDRRKRRSRSKEKESSRRDPIRSRSRDDRKRSKSKDRSKDKKSDDKDRRSESKAKTTR